MDEDFDSASDYGEFNEDALDNADYELLYAAFPKAKEQLASYNSLIKDLDIKEALYYNDFEIAPALKELRTRFPKKKEEIQPKQSKLALLAKSRAQNGQLLSPGVGPPPRTLSATSSSSEPISKLPQKGKLSKLAALAKSRVSKDCSAISDNSTSGERISPSSSPLTLIRSDHSLRPASQRKPIGDHPLNSKTNDQSSGLVKLQLSRKPNHQAQRIRQKLCDNRSSVAADMDIDDENESHNRVPSVLENQPNFSVARGQKKGPSLSFELSVDRTRVLHTPCNSVSVYLFEESNGNTHVEESNKRRRLSHQLFYAYTNREASIAKAKSNFNSPSPDDKVLETQNQALESKVKNLSIQASIKPNEKKDAPANLVETKPYKTIDLSEEFTQNPIFTKPSRSFVIIGHVDAGKSTLMGRILFDLGAVDAKTVNKLVREAEKAGKGSFALAWVMDQTSEERSRGVTIDICATNFETEHTRFTAIDAPGHKDFVPQMIGGASQAEIALLVVDSINGEFEAGFHMDGQTKEHTLLVKSLGVGKICVAINKLDKENWSQTRFEDIREQVYQFLTSEDIGFKTDEIEFVPISGLSGTNVVKNDKSISKFSWYSGPTLIECLEQFASTNSIKYSAKTLLDKEFNMAITDIVDVNNSEFSVKGRISQGMIQPGNTVCVHPSDDYLQVQNMQCNEQMVQVAVEGQIVLLNFKTNHLKNKSIDDLAVGDLVSSLKSSIYSVKKFEAELNTFDLTKPLLVGTPFVLFRNSASVAARISQVLKVNGMKKKKMHLVSRQTAVVVIEILDERNLPISKYVDNKILGRIVIRREGTTVGAGSVTKLLS